MHVEPLEPRLKLSAALAASGLLTITGTAGNDKVSLTRTKPTKTKPAYLVVTEKIVTKKPDGSGTLTTAETTNFPLDKVKSLLVNVGDGDDSVSVVGGTKYRLSFPATINGGLGKDSLTGGEGPDLINGNDGDDLLNGGLGDDSLFGHAGKDRLTGGAGVDQLNGGAGQDRLYSSADNAIDTVDGGGLADNDYAMVDKADAVTNVKRVKNPVLT